MSLISEALKKAQRERDEYYARSGDNPSVPGKRDVRPLWKSPLVLVAVLALTLGILGVWLTRAPAVQLQSSSTPLVVEEVPSSAPIAVKSEPTVAEEKGKTGAPVAAAQTVEKALPDVKEESERFVAPEKETEVRAVPGEPVAVTGRITAEKDKPEVSPEEELQIKLRTAESADDYVRLYQLLRQQGDDSRAFEMVKRGLASFPEHGVLNRLGLIGYVRARDYRKALLHAGPALEADPDRPTLLTYRGLCHFHLKDYPRALADFGRSLAIDPEATENIYYLALIYDNEGQYDVAIRYYRMFLDKHPQNRSFRHENYIIDRLAQLNRQREGR